MSKVQAAAHLAAVDLVNMIRPAITNPTETSSHHAGKKSVSGLDMLANGAGLSSNFSSKPKEGMMKKSQVKLIVAWQSTEAYSDRVRTSTHERSTPSTNAFKMPGQPWLTCVAAKKVVEPRTASHSGQ